MNDCILLYKIFGGMRVIDMEGQKKRGGGVNGERPHLTFFSFSDNFFGKKCQVFINFSQKQHEKEYQNTNFFFFVHGHLI